MTFSTIGFQGDYSGLSVLFGARKGKNKKSKKKKALIQEQRRLANLQKTQKGPGSLMYAPTLLSHGDTYTKTPAAPIAATPSLPVHPDVSAFEKTLKFPMFAFQKDAMSHRANGKSVLVAAPTSSGKTLVAEYAIWKALEDNKAGKPSRVFYTVPRKAIANEKFEDFTRQFGKDNVGLMTGDATINRNASVILMTTEVLRNMLYDPMASADALADLKDIVFDECHFLNDPDRGVVWEESMLYAAKSLPKVHQIHLSATIQNAQEMTSWLNGLRGQKTETVISEKRPVPLHEFYIPPKGGLIRMFDEEHTELSEQFVRAYRNVEKAFVGRGKDAQEIRDFHELGFNARHIVNLLSQKKMLPAIVFAFGRRKCESFAGKLAFRADLTTDAEKQQIRTIVDAYLKMYPWLIDSPLFEGGAEQSMLLKGIAPHHSGMLPAEKRLVEQLLKKGLLKVVFATDTLAAGINVPAQTVVLSEMERFGDEGAELLNTSDYQQITGRAGRLGMFDPGYAVVSHPPQGVDMQYMTELVSSAPNKVNSHFQVTSRMVLNLVHRLGLDGSKKLLKESYHVFQEDAALDKKAKDKTQPSRMLADFEAMVQVLSNREFPYLKPDGKLSTLGHLSASIQSEHNMLLAEAIEQKVLDDLTPIELASAISSLTVKKRQLRNNQEPAKVDLSLLPKDLAKSLEAIQKLEGLIETAQCQESESLDDSYANIVRQWCTDGNWQDVQQSQGHFRGDIFQVLRRTANLLDSLIESPFTPPALADKAREAVRLLLQSPVREQVLPHVDLGDRSPI